MTFPHAAKRTIGVTSLLGVTFCLCAVQKADRREIFREDQDAVVLASTRMPSDFEFLSEWASILRTEDGDTIRLGIHDHFESAVTVRGPSTLIGSVTSTGYPDPAGAVFVAWDEYNGEAEHGGSFDVLGAFYVDGEMQPPFVIAGGPAFQARPSVAAIRLPEEGEASSNFVEFGVDGKPEFWVAWEEGSDAWGAPYRSVDGQWNNVTDTSGPLHAWRRIKLARIGLDGSVTEVDVPMPSFDVQRLEPSRRPGAERVGVFYERPVLHKDEGSGSLWLAYRHMHQREASLQIPKMTTHVERGFAVYLRRLTDGGFGPLYRIDERQRDGEQRLGFHWSAEGSFAALEVGRSDRRKPRSHRGVRRVSLPARSSTTAAHLHTTRAPTPAPEPEVRERNHPRTDANGAPFTLLFGDLHRHTDLSLCFPFFDGSLDDAYRYAKGPAALDFVAVTDHARDLDQGRGTGRPWKLHVAAADKHHLPGRFAAFRAYERSQGHTDHNVIGLQEDADFLRPHRPPLREFWSEFQPEDVFTIPHATAAQPGARFCGNVWTKRDDLRRPIAEIYQGFRDVSSMDELQTKALLTGQKLGFIASSDHLATSSAYACVWAAGEASQAIDRAPIYSALQSRRCYGATARIELKVQASDPGTPGTLHWMGADLPDAESFQIDVSGLGTDSIQSVEYWSGGEVIHATPGGVDKSFESGFLWQPSAEAQQYLFVRVIQEDGEHAWSSPFFLRWPTVTERGAEEDK